MPFFLDFFNAFLDPCDSERDFFLFLLQLLKSDDLIAQLGKVGRLGSAFTPEIDLTLLQEAPLMTKRHAGSLATDFQSNLAKAGTNETHGLTMLRSLRFFRFSQFCQDTEIFECCRVTRDLRAASDFFQQPAHDFATARLGQRFSKANFIWFCDCPDVHANMLTQFRFQSAGDVYARFQCHKCDDALSF